jgi:hypothetical protein
MTTFELLDFLYTDVGRKYLQHIAGSWRGKEWGVKAEAIR